jgi:hypothetical protein
MPKTISFTMKDANHALALDAVATATGWTPTIPNPADPEATIPNPVSKAQNMDRWLKAKLRNEITEQANRVALANVTVDGDM